jgi:hypothetical protein
MPTAIIERTTPGTPVEVLVGPYKGYKGTFVKWEIRHGCEIAIVKVPYKREFDQYETEYFLQLREGSFRTLS